MDGDPALELVHVFQTSVLTSISDNEATITYQSNDQFIGIDGFEFVTTDGFDTSAPAMVEVRVQASNHRAPVARPVSTSGAEDQSIPVQLAGQDPDAGFGPLTYTIADPPQYGNVSGSGASRSYQPNADFFGTDRFSYKVSDGSFSSETAQVTVTVNPVNDPPEVDLPNPVYAKLNEQTVFVFGFSDADPGDVHTVSIDWGDGTQEEEGRLLEDGTATGPLLSENAQGDGFVSAPHRYTGAPGVRTVEACITDNMTVTESGKQPTAMSTTRCATTALEVGPRIFTHRFE